MLRSFGALGGMGPASTVRFLEQVIKNFSKKLGAIQNDEFPRIVLTTIPGSDHMFERTHLDMAAQIRCALSLLEKAKLDFFVAICNTVHIEIESYAFHSRIPMLHVVTAVEYVNSADLGIGENILFLSTTKTRNSSLYTSMFERARSTLNYPNRADQEALEQMIISLNTGVVNSDCIACLNRIVANHRCDAVFLACTELSFLKRHLRHPRVIDSLESLALATFLLSSGAIDLEALTTNFGTDK